GYQPKIIQTDNGSEFTYFQETKRLHPFDRFYQERGIPHQLIRPRTPRHKGKVARSHRHDSERFYSRLSFDSYGDLLVQMKRYLYKSNRLPMQTRQWMTPIEK
ncbi:MAG: IS481 family transposase, partial [Peptostreptococcus porci]|nr:IS481 family transposase [Peptostreptococcus porci]